MITRQCFRIRPGCVGLLLVCAASTFPQLSLADTITFAAPSITLHESGSVQTGFFDVVASNFADSNTTGGAGDTAYTEAQGYGPGVTNTNGSDLVTAFSVEVTTSGAVTFPYSDDQTQSATFGGPDPYLFQTNSSDDPTFNGSGTNNQFTNQDVFNIDIASNAGTILTSGTPLGLLRVQYSIPAATTGTFPLTIVSAVNDPAAGSFWSDSQFNNNIPLIVNGSITVTPEPSGWTLAGMSLCALPAGRRLARSRRVRPIAAPKAPSLSG